MRKIGTHMRGHFVAYLALFFALGGTSIAAVNALPANSVGSKQIINGSIQKTDLAKRTVSSLRGLRGTRGLQGPAGPAGPQGAAGPTGPQGSQGIQGPRGPAGDSAPAGGEANLVSGGGSAIPTTAGILFSKSIHAPAAGEIIAIATGSVYLGGLQAGDNYLVRLKLNAGTSTDTTEDGQVIFIRDTNSNSGTRMVPFSASRVFSVSAAGTYTYNLTGWLQVNPGRTLLSDDTVVTLVWVPADYS